MDAGGTTGNQRFFSPTCLSLLLIAASIEFTNSTTSGNHWALEVQLHNYTNLYDAYYDSTQRSACCCHSTSLTPTCNHHVTKLKCADNPPGPLDPGGQNKYCSSVFEFCIEGKCITYPESYSTSIVTFNGVTSDDFTIYSILEYNGSFTKESVKLVIVVHQQSSTLLDKQYYIDNFTIPLNLDRTSEFSEPILTDGAHGIASFTIAYRLHCTANYYGKDCSVFCEDSSSKSTGFFTCDSNGAKICDAGYTNPDNNCKDKATTTSDCIFHTTYFTSSCTGKLAPSSTSTGVTTNNCILYTSPSCEDKKVSTPSDKGIQEVTSCTTYTSTVVQPQSTSAVSAPTPVLPTTSSSVNGSGSHHNQSSSSRSCDCEHEDAAFAIVLTLLLLTYVGIAVIVFIKLWMCFRPLNCSLLSLGRTTCTQRILENPNYDSPTGKAPVTNAEISGSYQNEEAVYAPLITSTSRANEYELMDSQSSAYAVIDD